MFQLRPYQSKLLIGIKKSIQKGNKKIVAQAPCGAGKTIVIREIIDGGRKKNNKILFLAPRKELLLQCSKKLNQYSIEHGVLGHSILANPLANVQLTCWQGLKNKKNTTWIPDIIIYDECHGSVSEKAIEVLNRYPNSYLIGFTATPYRDDELGLGDLYEDLVTSCQTSDLINQGYLIKPKYFNIKTSNENQLEAITFDSKEESVDIEEADVVIGADLIRNFKKICPTAKTCVFCPSIEKAEEIALKFENAGFSAKSVGAKTPAKKREKILEDFSNDKFQIICCAQLLKEGWDDPYLNCVIILRNLTSRVFFRQAVGRVMRIPPDGSSKQSIVLDFFNCIEKFGLPWEDEEYSLEEGVKGESKIKETNKDDFDKLLCKNCGTIFDNTLTKCPNCGSNFKKLQKLVVEAISDLEEIKEKNIPTIEDKQRKYTELCAICMNKKRKPGWVAHEYKSIFGVFPRKMKKTKYFEEYCKQFERTKIQNDPKIRELFNDLTFE